MDDLEKIEIVLKTFGWPGKKCGIKLKETEPGFYRIFTTRWACTSHIKKDLMNAGLQYVPDVIPVKEFS